MSENAFTLTPLDVRKQEFKKTLRGFDPIGVEDFRTRVAQAEARRILDDVKGEESEVRRRLAEAEGQFQAYIGGFRALVERQLAELKVLGGQREG